MKRITLPAHESEGRLRWRVLFVITSSDVGGTESFLERLVLGLDRRVFDPVVCSLRPCGGVAERLRAAGVPVVSADMSAKPQIPELARGVLQLVRWIDAFDIDLVQSLLYRANVLAAMAGRLSRRHPLVVAGQRSLNPLGGRPAALAARWTRHLAHHVVAVSQAVRRQLLAEDGIEPDRVVVIENGVDCARFCPGDRAKARAELGIEPTGFLVGAVGRLSPEKGFHTLLEALALVPGANLLLAGDGPARCDLERQAGALQLDGRVRFLGVLPDPVPVYAAADVFVLPSVEEGSPNALLEAMACRCAVVASAVGGIPEIVEDGRSGLLVEPGCAPALAQAIEFLARNQTLRMRLGIRARRRVHAAFDLSRMVARHADLYRELLEPKRAA